MLETLPLDSAKRATLKDAITRREYSKAEQLLAGEAEHNPRSQAILLVLANVLFLDGRHLNCAVVLNKAGRLGPLDERSRFLLVLAYIAAGRLNWARPELEALARSNPSSALYPYWLSRIGYRKMDIRSALAQAQRAVQLDPAFMKAYDQLGLCYEALNQWDEAIAAFQQAIRLNRQLPARSPWPSLNLGLLLLRLERLDEADAHLRDSLAIEPRFPAARFRLGQVLEKKERYDEAVAELEQSCKLDPTYPEPHYVLARIHKKRGDTKAAERELSIFQDLRKKDKLKGITRPD